MKLYWHYLIVLCLFVAGCTAPPYNAHEQNTTIGNGGAQGSFLVGAKAGLSFFMPLDISCHRAVEDADLTRVDNEDRPAQPRTRRIVLYFHRSIRLGNDIVFTDGENGETVVGLVCEDLVPAWVRVRQQWPSPQPNVGACQEVEENKFETFTYDIAENANELVVAYQDGRQLRCHRFDINNGDLSIR